MAASVITSTVLCILVGNAITTGHNLRVHPRHTIQFNSSEEEVFRAAGLRSSSSRFRDYSAHVQSKCRSEGPSYDPNEIDYPDENDMCFSETVNHKAPYRYPGNCQQYLYCHPSDCVWRKVVCNAGLYWNNILGECVEAPEFACGGALFGMGAVVQIENVYYNDRILNDCRRCGVKSWKDETPVVGFRKESRPEWYQILVAERRNNRLYYSLAFLMGNENQVKVITALANDEVVSKMLDTGHQLPSLWWFAPVIGERKKVRIISVASGKALTMTRIGGTDFKVRVTNFDAQDKKQEWIVRGMDGNPLSL